jgi:hypothetical protein
MGTATVRSDKEAEMNEDLLEQQRQRTQRGVQMLAEGSVRFEPEGQDRWRGIGPDGNLHYVEPARCDCEDFSMRCAPLRIRCKHIEALRIATAALPQTAPGLRCNGHGDPSGAGLMERLGAPFPAEAIHWKPQKVSFQGNRALAVPYLDAREVAQRLDEVVGPLGWQVVHQTLGDQLVTGIGIRDPATGCWAWKWDSGFVGRREGEDEGEAGGADARRRSEDEEKSRKGTLSDGLKRAAVLWGIGRYLYRLSKVWVAYDGKAKTLMETPHLPAWALPPSPVPGAIVPAHFGATTGSPVANETTAAPREPVPQRERAAVPSAAAHPKGPQARDTTTKQAEPAPAPPGSANSVTKKPSPQDHPFGQQPSK